jgi:ELWxxDGT repeat protein
VLDGRLIFVMEKTTGRITMWTSDGTVAGTQQLNDHSSTANVGIVGIAGAVVGERFFFFGLDPQTGQPALFTTHALLGTTQKVIDLEVVPTGGTAWNGRFYWVNEDAAHGREWWVSDGTAAGTRIVADISLGSRDGAIFDESLVRADGLLIGGNGPFGHEPWIISGSPPRARELKNIAVDTPKPGSNPEELRAAGAQLFFLADAPGYRVVGKSDGRATTTDLITPTDEWWFAETFASGSRYYLQFGSTLISTDGSPSGTEVLSTTVLSAVAFHRGVVFAELGDQTMRFSDGTIAGTSIIQPLPGFVFANWSLFSANGLVWFTNGSALAVSDGFSPMRRIQPASGTIGSIREVVEGPDATYFVDESIQGKRLWRTDGTNAGTRIVTTFAQLPTDFVATGDKLFFTQGSVLWSTGGVEGNTVPLGAPGVSSSCGGVAMLGNVLYWSARQNNGTAVVWKSDGTPGGTVEVASFPASPQGCVSMAALDGQVYFRGYDAEHGTELWVTNGTTPGTHLVADLNPGSEGSDPRELTVAGAHLFFTADTAGRGRELWAIEQLTRRRAVGHP